MEKPVKINAKQPIAILPQRDYFKTMFDDLPQKKKTSEFPRDLENMSVTEIQEYIAEMTAEIARAEADIEKKQASMNAADSFFK